MVKKGTSQNNTKIGFVKGKTRYLAQLTKQCQHLTIKVAAEDL